MDMPKKDKKEKCGTGIFCRTKKGRRSVLGFAAEILFNLPGE